MTINRFDQEQHIRNLPLPISLRIKYVNANNKLNLANSGIQNLTLDEWKMLGQIIKLNNWTILDLSRNTIYDMSNEQIEAMTATLRDSSISHLIIDNALIGCSKSQIQLLTEKLSGSEIKTIEFGINDIEFFLLKKEQCLELFRAMGVKHLKFTNVFDMSPNLSTRVGFVKELIEYLNIEELTLIRCGMENLPSDEFSQLFSSCCGLRKLVLSGDNFSNLDNNKWEMFHAFLAKASLETLQLNDNELGRCGSRLSDVIKNTKSKRLVLKNNWLFYLADGDTTQLIQSIKENSLVVILINDKLGAKQSKMLAKLSAETNKCVLINDTYGSESKYLSAHFIFNKPPIGTLVGPERKDSPEHRALLSSKPA